LKRIECQVLISYGKPQPKRGIKGTFEKTNIILFK